MSPALWFFAGGCTGAILVVLAMAWLTRHEGDDDGEF